TSATCASRQRTREASIGAADIRMSYSSTAQRLRILPAVVEAVDGDDRRGDSKIVCKVARRELSLFAGQEHEVIVLPADWQQFFAGASGDLESHQQRDRVRAVRHPRRGLTLGADRLRSQVFHRKLYRRQFLQQRVVGERRAGRDVPRALVKIQNIRLGRKPV